MRIENTFSWNERALIPARGEPFVCRENVLSLPQGTGLPPPSLGGGVSSVKSVCGRGGRRGRGGVMVSAQAPCSLAMDDLSECNAQNWFNQ